MKNRNVKVWLFALCGILIALSGNAQKIKTTEGLNNEAILAALDALTIDLHVIHKQNGATFKQYQNIKKNQTFTYPLFPEVKRVREFGVYIHPSEMNLETHPQLQFITLRYYDDKGTLLAKETTRILPHEQITKIWTGKSKKMETLMPNARFAELTLRILVPGAKRTSDLKYRIKLEAAK